jgi:lipopolysaccharide export LptBFGC system permease protein LptF
MEEEFEDTKGVIRIRKSKKNRQHNGQKKKYKRTNNDLQNIYIKQYKRTNNDLQNIYIKLRSSNRNPTKNRGVNSGAPEG